MSSLQHFRAIAFDADDTLWDCQSHFEAVENQLYALIAPYCEQPARELYATESANMADLGYGCKAFTISIMETALRVAGPHLTSTQLSDLLSACKALLHLPATPLPGVEPTLQLLYNRAKANGWQLAVFTKGELQDQENKLQRSGLRHYFSHVEITSDKTKAHYLALCNHLGVSPAELLMVGNSFRSDIAPALAIGAQAVHIPFHVTWQLEDVEEFEHERCTKLQCFSQLAELLAD